MFNANSCAKLKHYVYLYIDPRTDQPFYVGKGQNNRCIAHVRDSGPSDKSRIIRELKALGLEPRIDLLKYGLTESEAYLVESTAIDLLNIENLSNQVRGSGSRIGGRGQVREIADRLNARPVTITDPVILISIARMYRPAMDLQDLYDATRCAWKVGPKRDRAKYALANHAGVVREIFEIAGWFVGGSTMKRRDREGRPESRSARWEFVGRVADDAARRKYIGRSVAGYYRRGAQNPIQYVNCD